MELDEQVDSENAKRTDIDYELKIYLTALAFAAVGWIALIALSVVREPSSAAAPSTHEPGSVELLLFALAGFSGLRAHAAVEGSRDLRATFGDPEVAARVRFTRLRRLMLALAPGCLVVAVITIVVGWFTDPSLTMTLVKVGFLVSGVTSLVGARGIRRGWIEGAVSPILGQQTPQDVHAALSVLAKQREEIRKNETILRTQRREIRDIYKSIKEDERRSVSWIPPNLRWALVGFVFGIIGNWLTEPLFKILIVPLNT